MRWLARLKMFLQRYMLLNEFCHDCGRQVTQVWTTSDERWARVMRIPAGDSFVTSWREGPRCIPCFDDRAWRSASPLRWVPVRLEQLHPPDNWAELVDRATVMPAAIIALISAGSEVLDKAADVEFDGWSREHTALEAAYGQLITALEPFAVNVRRAKAEARRPA